MQNEQYKIMDWLNKRGMPRSLSVYVQFRRTDVLMYMQVTCYMVQWLGSTKISVCIYVFVVRCTITIYLQGMLPSMCVH